MSAGLLAMITAQTCGNRPRNGSPPAASERHDVGGGTQDGRALRGATLVMLTSGNRLHVRRRSLDRRQLLATGQTRVTAVDGGTGRDDLEPGPRSTHARTRPRPRRRSAAARVRRRRARLRPRPTPRTDSARRTASSGWRGSSLVTRDRDDSVTGEPSGRVALRRAVVDAAVRPRRRRWWRPGARAGQPAVGVRHAAVRAAAMARPRSPGPTTPLLTLAAGVLVVHGDDGSLYRAGP